MEKKLLMRSNSLPGGTAFHHYGDDRVAGTGQGEPGNSPCHVGEPDSGQGESLRAMWERSVQECHGPELE